MTEDLRQRIINHEGLRLKVYRDSLGYDTIGVGRLLSNGISNDEAMLMLDNDIKRAKQESIKNMPWLINIDENRQDIIYEMCFNLGISRLMMFKKMLAALQKEDFQEASAQMLNSNWAAQVGKRAIELASIMENGA